MPAFCRVLPMLALTALCSVPRAEVAPFWIAGDGGIYRCQLDVASGRLSPPQRLVEMPTGSWLAVHPSLPVLYTSLGGAAGAGIAALRFDAAGNLERWEACALPGGAATHLAVAPDGGTLATADYGDASVSLVRLRDDGGVADAAVFTLTMPFRGPGPVRVQSQPRPHWVGYAAAGTRLQVPDLGNDVVWTLAVDAAALTLAVAEQVELPRGAGPRHLATHPVLPVVYVNGELGSIVAQLRLDAGGERLTLLDTWPTVLETDDAPSNDTSEVRVHPSGRFLYVGNRGHDSIAVFAIDPATGALQPVEREPVRGSWPRNFNLDPSGRWLVAAGQRSGTLASFAVDQDTGALRHTRSVVNVPEPVRVLFVP